MKTYVAEISGEPILAFRAEDDAAAERVVHEKDGGFQLVVRGYSGLTRADGCALGDGTSPVTVRLALPPEHEQWLVLQQAQAGTADNPDDWVIYLVPVVSVDERRGQVASRSGNRSVGHGKSSQPSGESWERQMEAWEFVRRYAGYWGAVNMVTVRWIG
jgi:hypothetical protein